MEHPSYLFNVPRNSSQCLYHHFVLFPPGINETDQGLSVNFWPDAVWSWWDLYTDDIRVWWLPTRWSNMTIADKFNHFLLVLVKTKITVVTRMWLTMLMTETKFLVQFLACFLKSVHNTSGYTCEWWHCGGFIILTETE